MKNLLKFAFMAVATAGLFACGNDNDDPDAPKPTITVEELGTGTVNQDITVAPGTTLLFKWNALKTGDGAKLDMFEIDQTGVNVSVPLPTTFNGETLPITNMPNRYESQYVDTIAISAGNNAGVTTYTFSVTDKNGNNVSQSISVTVVSSTPLGATMTGSFYHIAGTLQGSYSIVNDALVSASGSDADKDLHNTDAAGAAFTGSFDSKNNTTFVKVTGFDFENATVESAEAAFMAGTSATSVSNPAVGDVFVLNLKGAGNYSVVRITALDPNDGTCNCGNEGKITFEYKK